MIKIFVTGGAGYIGSNFIRYIIEESKIDSQIIIYDDLRTGSKDNILYGDFIQGSLEDTDFLYSTLKKFSPDFILHFASSVKVEESMLNPYYYYQNNFRNTMNLLFIAEELLIPNFIFSSTAAVYGDPKIEIPISEDINKNPINPYGMSKKMVEDMLFSISKEWNINFGILRYFNVVGTDQKSRIGKADPSPSHLLDRIILSHIGKLDMDFSVFGNDYSTKDGSCVRDYIEMDDLIYAHILLMNNMIDKKIKNEVFNVGYGKGYSVFDIISKVEEVLKTKISYQIADRRPGDPSFLVADSTKIQNKLSWKYNSNALEKMILSSYHFLSR